MRKLLLGLIGLLFAVPAVASNLPAGYTEVEYLESDGNQIINTGYVVQETDSVEVDYTLTNVDRNNDKFIIGAQPISGDQTKGFWVETYGANNTWYVRFGSPASANSSSSGATPSSQLSGTFIVSKNSFVVNGTKILTPEFSAMSTNPMTIFNRLTSSGAVTEFGASAQISEVRVKNGNNIIHIYIPARNSSGVLGMYDTVSGQFFTNAGTGEFIAGPVIPEQQIRIATTAYNSARFSPVVTELNDTIATIRDVVTNTINQTKAIADLQATKQTRPNENCPTGKKCLLVEDNDGTPHWFEIIESPVVQ